MILMLLPTVPLHYKLSLLWCFRLKRNHISEQKPHRAPLLLYVPSEKEDEIHRLSAVVPINRLSPDLTGVKVQVLRDHHCLFWDCWVMEWEIQVKRKDLDALSCTSLHSKHTAGLMLELGPLAASIMTMKGP